MKNEYERPEKILQTIYNRAIETLHKSVIDDKNINERVEYQ